MIPPYQNINVHFDLITITPFISRGRVDILLQTKNLLCGVVKSSIFINY